MTSTPATAATEKKHTWDVRISFSVRVDYFDEAGNRVESRKFNAYGDTKIINFREIEAKLYLHGWAKARVTTWVTDDLCNQFDHQDTYEIVSPVRGAEHTHTAREVFSLKRPDFIRTIMDTIEVADAPVAFPRRYKNKVENCA